MSLTVICVLKSGGLYTADWVDKLQEGVATHLSAKHRFVCLTDTKVHCEALPLLNNWPSWWSKIELFRFSGGPFLYLDLDTVITGPLDDLPRATPGFTMVRDFIGGDKGWHNSSVMSWRGDFSAIYDTFCDRPRNVQEIYRRHPSGRTGDQAFTEDALISLDQKIDTFAPGRVVSYKRDARYSVPPGASVVCAHGRPKPHEIDVEWVKQLWGKLP